MKKIKTSFLRRQESIKMLEKTFFYLTQLSLPKLRNHFIVTLVLMLLSLQSYSQGMMAPPSPNAQALARYAAVPVNHYTGIPSINIPLYTLPGKELSVPVSLSYHAGGNKVQDVASWVGLGWSLNAGGVITRVVRGLPDEDDNGYCGVNNIGYKANTEYSGQAKIDYFNNLASGTWDGEPDMFYFNFLGMTGKFYLDYNCNPVMVPYQDIIIKPGICDGANGEWEIIDGNGTKYYFGTTALSRENSTTKVWSFTGDYDTFSSTSSWYLTKIESANSTDNITFYYTVDGNITSEYKLNQKIINSALNDYFGVREGDVRTQRTTINTVPIYLSRISSSQGSISFYRDDVKRSDLEGGESLSKIIIKNSDFEIIKEYTLNHTYFSSGCSTEKCKRLKLESLNENGQPACIFGYNTTNLPARNSFSYDHWGYYNNSTSTFGIGQKDSDEVKSKANILQSISYLSGGMVSFNYEAKRYLDENGIEQIGGGIRILSKEVSDGSSSVFTNYSYLKSNGTSSGLLYMLPIYNESFDVDASYAYPNLIFTITRATSASLNTIFDLNGISVGYSRVVEYDDLGKSIYQFTDLVSNGDTFSSFYKVTDGNQVGSFNRPPYLPGNDNSWERGLPLITIAKDANGKTLSRITNEYDFTLSNKRTIKGVIVGDKGFEGSGNSIYVMGKYSMTSKPMVLKSKTTEIYDLTDVSNARKTINKEEYFYNSTNTQLIEKVSYNQRDLTTKYITKTKFLSHPDYSYDKQVCDYNFDQCMSNTNGGYTIYECFQTRTACYNATITDSNSKRFNEMQKAHLINIPVEQYSMYEENGSRYISSIQYNTFQTLGSSNNRYYPQKSYVYRGEPILESSYSSSKITEGTGTFESPSVTMELIGTSYFSASTGQLTSQTANDGTETTYNYDNATGILSSTETKSPYISGGTRLTTTASQVVTPLVGVTQKTDANGRQVNYTYDKKGRLKYVKDHNGNIVTRYRYNTETPLTSQIEFSGSNLVGDQISFKALNPFDHGVSNITWGFGDGTVLENSSENVSHAFTSAGIYTINFTVANPEYELLSVTKAINIVDRMSSGRILSNGNTLADVNLCYEEDKIYAYLTAQVSGGCNNKTYVWSKKVNSGNWYLIDNPIVGFGVVTSGTYYIRCVVTDECGNSYTINDEITVTNDDC